MKLENQVVSLDLAKRLKELGVKQESLFYWILDQRIVFKTDIGCYLQNGGGVDDKYLEEDSTCSAYTVAELGEMLPKSINYKRNGTYEDVFFSVVGDKADIYYRNIELDKSRFAQRAETEADARAKLLIYLLENGLLK